MFRNGRISFHCCICVFMKNTSVWPWSLIFCALKMQRIESLQWWSTIKDGCFELSSHKQSISISIQRDKGKGRETFGTEKMECFQTNSPYLPAGKCHFSRRTSHIRWSSRPSLSERKAVELTEQRQTGLLSQSASVSGETDFCRLLIRRRAYRTGLVARTHLRSWTEVVGIDFEPRVNLYKRDI